VTRADSDIVTSDRRTLRKCRRDARGDAGTSSTARHSRPPGALHGTTPPASRRDPAPRPPASRWIECPERDCSKKYRDVNALVYHRNHSHSNHSVSAASAKKKMAAIQDGGETRKRKCDDVTEPTDDAKCRRVTETETHGQTSGAKQEVTSEGDRKSESPCSTHAQTDSNVVAHHEQEEEEETKLVCNGVVSESEMANIGDRDRFEDPVTQVQASRSARDSCVPPAKSDVSAEPDPTQLPARSITGQQLHAAAVEYIQLESIRQAYLQMVASASNTAPGSSPASLAHLQVPPVGHPYHRMQIMSAPGSGVQGNVAAWSNDVGSLSGDLAGRSEQPLDMSSPWRDRRASNPSTTTSANGTTFAVAGAAAWASSPIRTGSRSLVGSNGGEIPAGVSSRSWRQSSQSEGYRSPALRPSEAFASQSNYDRPSSPRDKGDRTSSVFGPACMASQPPATKHRASSPSLAAFADGRRNDQSPSLTKRHLHTHHHTHVINPQPPYPHPSIFPHYPPIYR